MNSRPSAGAERINGLLQWWGMSAASPDLERFVKIVGDVQQAYLAATERHVESVFAANDRLRKLARAAFDLQRPPEFLRAQTEIVQALTQASADYLSTWAQLNADVERLCREIAAPTDGVRPAAAQQSPPKPAPQRAERQVSHAAAA